MQKTMQSKVINAMQYYWSKTSQWQIEISWRGVHQPIFTASRGEGLGEEGGSASGWVVSRGGLQPGGLGRPP